MTTTDTLVTPHDVRVLRRAPGGPTLDGESAALDVIGDAFGQEAELVAVPVERIADEFFRLRSGVGGVMQKSANHRLRLAVVGDVSRHIAESTAQREFVHETDNGGHIWFLPAYDALDARPRPAG